MVKHLSHILFFALLFACSNPKKTEESAKNSNKETVKETGNSFASGGSENYSLPIENIIVKALYNTSYCGGAKPPEEILAKHREQRILKNSEIKLIMRPSNYELKIRTDKNGLFDLIFDNNSDFEYYLTNNIDLLTVNINTNCDALLKRKFGTFKMTSPKDTISILFHLPCDPCDPYSKMRP